LVVSQWAGKPGNSTPAWRVLDSFLAERPSVKPGVLGKLPIAPLPDLSDQSRRTAHEARETARGTMQVPCFETLPVSALASHGACSPASAVEGPAGSDWGSLIHELLQYAAAHLAATRQELQSVAKWYAGGDSTITEYIPPALATVEMVRTSEFWQRVAAAEERLTEVPVGAPWDGQKARVLAKGIIDLVLRTPQGWHIIDYKTDALSVDQLVQDYRDQLQAYVRIWEKITGNSVVFAGIYSVRQLKLSGDVRDDMLTASGAIGRSNGSRPPR
jgi:ATP-dependent exoDNAse (exonuclease V) beta subunit